jgi:hypothetical protein
MKNVNAMKINGHEIFYTPRIGQHWHWHWQGQWHWQQLQSECGHYAKAMTDED